MRLGLLFINLFILSTALGSAVDCHPEKKQLELAIQSEILQLKELRKKQIQTRRERDLKYGTQKSMGNFTIHNNLSRDERKQITDLKIELRNNKIKAVKNFIKECGTNVYLALYSKYTPVSYGIGCFKVNNQYKIYVYNHSHLYDMTSTQDILRGGYQFYIDINQSFSNLKMCIGSMKSFVDTTKYTMAKGYNTGWNEKSYHSYKEFVDYLIEKINQSK